MKKSNFFLLCVAFGLAMTGSAIATLSKAGAGSAATAAGNVKKA